MTENYDAAVAAALQPDPAQSARVGFSAATDTNPDAYAEAQRVARRTGVPVATVFAMPKEMKRQDTLGTIDFNTLAKTSPATAALLADVEKAKIAHDDVENMSRMENALSFLGHSTLAGLNDLVGAGAKLADSLNPFTLSDQDAAVLFKDQPEKLKQMREQSPAMFLSRFARGRTEASKQNMLDMSPGAQATYGDLKYATTDTDKAAYLSPVKVIGDAIRSLPTTAALALTTYLTRGAAVQAEKQALAAGMTAVEARTVAVEAATNMAVKFGAASEGTIGYAQQALQTQNEIEGMPLDKIGQSPEFQKLVDQGYDPNAARIFLAATAGEQAGIGAGVVDAVTNAIGGKFLGKIIGEGGSLLPRVAKGFGNEAGVEFVQSGGEQWFQNVATQANADPSIDLSKDVLENMLQGLFVGGLTGGAFAGAAGRARHVEQAEQGAGVIAKLNELATVSKVLQRDPGTFEQFVAHATENGPVQQVFIDAQTLMQSGVAEQLAAVSPAIAAQLETAVQTGGQIAIPVEEYAARIAPTEYAQSLLDHLKTDPEGFSRAEAQQYMQGHAAELEQEVEHTLAEKQGDESFKASAEAVKASILAELNSINRFTDAKNEADATLYSAYYAVRAAQIGTTPEELFARRPVRFNAEKVGAGETAVFEQALASQPPKGWKHSTAGTDAAAMWEGKESAEAVFWTDLKGKLEQDAPANAGYSHSIGQSALTHIRNRHGDAAKEAAHGQEAVTSADIAQIPEIVTGYDDIRTDLKGGHGEQMVAYAKRTDDGVLVYLEAVTKKRRNMAGVSMWRYPPTVDVKQVLANAVSPDHYVQNVVAAYGNDSTEFNQGEQARGAFNPETFTVTLLKGADLSTALHEGAHFFFENDVTLAAELAQEAQMFGLDSLKPGEQQILADVSALLTWHGIQGNIDTQLAQWYGLQFEEKRAYHERTAESFEAYLFEGEAPSLELQPYFQKFRAWLLNVYRSLKEFLGRHPEAGKLDDSVRSVFDRMLASSEQITLAEQGRSMMPLFTSPEQAGRTPEEFAAYQALGTEATADAIDDLQARGLRDMAWLHNARGRIIKQLQKDAKAQRAAVEMDVRREVMSQPVYRAWSFLTNKIGAEDKIAPTPRAKSDPNSVDESRDSLFTAIAKLGGLNKDEVVSSWGTDPADKPQSGVFGKPLWRVGDGGLSLDAMAEQLAQYGYLTPDENGKVDLAEFERQFGEEMRGVEQYSVAFDYDATRETRPGDQVANPQALAAGRLDRATVATMDLPPEVAARIEALHMARKDALHPDIVAEMFGFSSGDELVRKLAAAETPRAEINALTDVRMLEQFGDLSSPEALEKAADKAIHNDARSRFVATEANALAKATGQRKVLASAAKEFARAMIARLKVRNVKPSQYANAEVRAAKASDQASKAGDLATAAAEKRNHLIQNYATRAAYDAQEEVDKGLRYLKKFDGEATRKGLDADYTDQIDALLERFDLRKGQSNKAVDKRAALAEWIKAQREAGLEPDISPALENEAFRESYKNLTVEEFRGLVDTVRQIEHLGRLKHRLLTTRDQRAYEAVRDEIAGSIREHSQGREADTRTPTTNMGRAVQGLKRFWASHIKAATWARVMDGGKDGGPMWEYFVRSANDSGDRETTMRAEATGRLTEILAPVFALGKMGGMGQFFPGINRSLNREARIALALNTGNTGNLQRLLGGEGWNMQQIAPVLQSLTAQEWAAVQAVWDHFESYRPQIAEKERRVYGKEPEWVNPQPFAVTTADGQTLMLRGGYYPIKYDPAASQRAEEHADAESAKRQLQGAYTTATTRRSFTKARVEEVSGRPLLYTLAGMYSGVNDVIHDLAWHEWLIDANRLLRSHTIDAAIRDHYGPEAKQQFKTWVQDVAEGEKGAADAGEAALGRLRQGVSAAGLGFNVMSALIQPLGITQSIVRVGAPWVARGVAKYIASPIDTTRAVNEMSSFMENRARTRFRELNELRNQVQDQTAFNEFVGRYAYFLMMRCQQMVDVPTWWGAYEKAIAEGNDETRAVSLADQAVIDAQGGGQTKDLSAIERGGPAVRLFTVFYSFMNTALNLGVSQTMTADTPAKKARLAADYAMLYVVPAVLGYFLKNAITPGDSGDDDPEKIAKKLLANQIDYLMGLMVVVREFGDAAKMVAGANDMGRSWPGPAGTRLVADVGVLAKQAHQGEFDDAFRKAAVNVVGDLFGLPSTQVNRTVTGAEALAEGKTANPAAIVFGFQEKR